MNKLQIIRAAFSGNYLTIGNPEDIDCVIGQSFGYEVDEAGKLKIDPVNLELAKFAIEKVLQYKKVPTLLQIEIANGYVNLANQEPTLTITESHQFNDKGEREYLDCWEVLNQSLEYMQENGLNHPLLLAQAHHIGRFAMQAMSHGMEPVVMAGLTNMFNENSVQKWTRSKPRWVFRETIGLYVLDHRGKL